MTDAASAVPDGYHTVTPYLIVPNADALLSFIEKAFGGKTRERHTDDDGRVMHAETTIGDSVIMVGQANDEWPPPARHDPPLRGRRGPGVPECFGRRRHLGPGAGGHALRGPVGRGGRPVGEPVVDGDADRIDVGSRSSGWFPTPWEASVTDTPTRRSHLALPAMDTPRSRDDPSVWKSREGPAIAPSAPCLIRRCCTKCHTCTNEHTGFHHDRKTPRHPCPRRS